ncbi:MAG: lytic murein transglycosylase B [Hylemonella sp.]
MAPVIHRRLYSTLLLSLTLAVGLTTVYAQSSSPKKLAATAAYAGNDQAMALADQIAQRQQLNRDWVRRAIGKARHMPQVVKLMTPLPTGTPKNWRAYRERFIEPRRIAQGVAFWRAQRETLARAEQTYGVPAWLIVGILGVETLFGQQTGNFRAIDALATLAFDFPSAHPRAAERSKYFRGELEHLLALKHAGLDPLRLQGSFAGALGMPQFMPSSWLRFAVDFDGDGRIDLFRSTADVIGSVANYFKIFNWQTGMPTHFDVRFDTSQLDLQALLAPDILPTFSVASFVARGALPDAAGMAHNGALALVELQNGDEAPSYVAGTDNFYAITRYNWSSYYAMAVIELGREIEASMLP